MSQITSGLGKGFFLKELTSYSHIFVKNKEQTDKQTKPTKTNKKNPNKPEQALLGQSEIRSYLELCSRFYYTIWILDFKIKKSE